MSVVGSERPATCSRTIVDDRAADHEDIVQRVDGADDPRAAVLARPGLDGGEDRHDEEARRCRIEEDLEGEAQAEAAGEELGQRNLVVRRRHRAGLKPDGDRQRRKRKQQERRRRELDAAVRQQRRGERAGGDADGEDEVDGDLDVNAAADALI